MCVCVCSSISGSAGSAIHGTHTSLEGIAWLFPIHRLSLAFYHPSIDGSVPRIHVDVDEVLAVIVEDDSSIDDTGDGIPRSGAVPKSTAGAGLKLFTVVLMHGKGGEEIEEQADGMKRTSYAIDQKRGPSYAS